MLKRCVLLLLLAFLILALAGPALLKGTSYFLLVSDDLAKADSIVVLAGNNPVRLPEAARLFREGYAPSIITSVEAEPLEEERKELREFHYRTLGIKPLTPSEYARKAFESLQVPSERVLLASTDVTSTYEEALAARKIIQKEGYQSIILVTSTYHMRRTLILFRLALKDTGVQIHHVTASNPFHSPEAWWQSERDVKRIFLEYVSLAHNMLYRILLRQERSSFDSA